MKWGRWIWIVTAVLVLRPLLLTAAKEKSWVEIRSPHFTVFSDAGDKKARRITHEFEKFHALIRQFLPSIQSEPSLPPVVIALSDERAFRSLLPEFWEQRGLMQPSGIFVGGPEKNYIALRLDMDDEYGYHVVYHEYVHLMMRLNYPPLPTWLDEGLAECFGYTVISNDSSVIGRASSLLLNILKNQQLLSIPELFAVDHESPYYREELKSSIFYAQSWALTHLLLLGDKTAHAPKLWNFLDLIRNNIPPDEAARDAFGDLKELENRLYEYILQSGFYSFRVKTPSIQKSGEYAIRAVPYIEMQTLLGDFFVSTQRWAEATRILNSVLAEDPRNPEALTSLGTYYTRQNQPEEADKYFMAAADAGSTSCMTYYYLGIEAFHRREYQEAEANFRRAIELNSGFASGYSALAGVLALKEENAEMALKHAMQAVKLEPGVLSHQLNLANVLMRLKKFDLAIQYGERIEAVAESNQDREEAEMFLFTARRLRDDFKAKQGAGEEGGRQPQGKTAQSGDRGSQAGPRETRISRTEAAKKALAETASERQRLLKEREEAFEKRAKAEREYLEEVDIARAGGSMELQGIITAVNCMDPTIMEVEIESDGSLQKLHIADYLNVRFGTVNFASEDWLDPCTDLVGRRVTVKFIATPGAAYAGEILSLGIYK